MVIQGVNAGAFVEVLSRAPTHPFFLPNMVMSVGCEKGWVIKAMRTCRVQLESGVFRDVKLLVAEDSWLRPIRPPREPLAVVRELEAAV